MLQTTATLLMPFPPPRILMLSRISFTILYDGHNNKYEPIRIPSWLTSCTTIRKIVIGRVNIMSQDVAVPYQNLIYMPLVRLFCCDTASNWAMLFFYNIMLQLATRWGRPRAVVGDNSEGHVFLELVGRESDGKIHVGIVKERQLERPHPIKCSEETAGFLELCKKLIETTTGVRLYSHRRTFININKLFYWSLQARYHNVGMSPSCLDRVQHDHRIVSA